MTVFFTSDLHLGHARVIDYCRRPFANVDEMNQALVARWNARVKSYDDVYILGDLALCKPGLAAALVGRLAGRMRLVFGNHDKALRKSYEGSGLFEWCKDLAEVKVPDIDAPDGAQRITLCHYPMITWPKSHHGAWMLHGHCHGSLPDDRRALRLDVGVDVWDYAPVSYDEIKARMSKKAFKPVDHHGAD